MFNKKMRFFVVLALVMIMVLGSLSVVSAAPKEKGYEMVFIVKSLQHPFFLRMIEGAKQAADDLGIDLVCVGPIKDYSSSEQLDLMDNFISKGVDAIIITAVDSTSIVRGVESANKAGILVATPNTKAYGGDVLTWVGIDNYDVGYGLAKYLADSLNGKGNVIILEGSPGASVMEERKAGFIDAFAKYPDIKILASQTANCNRTEGMALVENMLQRFPKIDGIVAADPTMIMGAVEASKAVGRLEEIKMVGFDVNNDILTAVKNGEVLCTGDQQEKNQSYFAILACWAKLNGYTPPKIQAIPFKFVTKDNLDEYQDLMK